MYHKIFIVSHYFFIRSHTIKNTKVPRSDGTRYKIAVGEHINFKRGLTSYVSFRSGRLNTHRYLVTGDTSIRSFIAVAS